MFGGAAGGSSNLGVVIVIGACLRRNVARIVCRRRGVMSGGVMSGMFVCDLGLGVAPGAIGGGSGNGVGSGLWTSFSVLLIVCLFNVSSVSFGAGAGMFGCGGIGIWFLGGIAVVVLSLGLPGILSTGSIGCWGSVGMVVLWNIWGSTL
jgi:hypothetical protein